MREHGFGMGLGKSFNKSWVGMSMKLGIQDIVWLGQSCGQYTWMGTGGVEDKVSTNCGVGMGLAIKYMGMCEVGENL